MYRPRPVTRTLSLSVSRKPSVATSRQVLSAATLSAHPRDRKHVARTVAIPPDALLRERRRACMQENRRKWEWEKDSIPLMIRFSIYASRKPWANNNAAKLPSSPRSDEACSCIHAPINRVTYISQQPAMFHDKYGSHLGPLPLQIWHSDFLFEHCTTFRVLVVNIQFP